MTTTATSNIRVFRLPRKKKLVVNIDGFYELVFYMAEELVKCVCFFFYGIALMFMIYGFCVFARFAIPQICRNFAPQETATAVENDAAY